VKGRAECVSGSVPWMRRLLSVLGRLCDASELPLTLAWALEFHIRAPRFIAGRWETGGSNGCDGRWEEPGVDGGSESKEVKQCMYCIVRVLAAD
jgi:hypothetical protein